MYLLTYKLFCHKDNRYLGVQLASYNTEIRTYSNDLLCCTAVLIDFTYVSYAQYHVAQLLHVATFTVLSNAKSNVWKHYNN